MPETDLTEMRRLWAARREALAVILRRIDPRGMMRPARAPEERAWLSTRASTPFVEDETAAAAASEYYRRRYQR